MPQMNPIWWVTLSLMFIAAFLLTNSMNYFYKNIKINKSVNNKNMDKTFNWKW